MIKLIVSDVDGTLVEDGSPELNPEIFKAILKLRGKGSNCQWKALGQCAEGL